LFIHLFIIKLNGFYSVPQEWYIETT